MNDKRLKSFQKKSCPKNTALTQTRTDFYGFLRLNLGRKSLLLKELHKRYLPILFHNATTSIIHLIPIQTNVTPHQLQELDHLALLYKLQAPIPKYALSRIQQQEQPTIPEDQTPIHTLELNVVAGP